MRRILASLTAATLLAGLSATAALAGGPPGIGFYVDGQIYRTVGTPTDFSGTGAPSHTYDTIYAIPGQMNVAEAAPGDTDFNGGRWVVLGVTWNAAPYLLNSEEDVLAAEAAGHLSVNRDEPLRSFLCPVIKIQPNH
jgi:hypothetical protein